MTDPHSPLADLHAAELHRAAGEHRLAMAAARRRTRPSRLARLYARLWWASRPRATSWAPALLEPRY